MKASVMKGMVAGLALAAAVPMTASAAVSGNIGFTSNYLWRGQTQTQDGPAISGGLDYSHSSGFYAGLWTSNESWTSTTPGASGTELDTYLGFSGKAGGFTYDIGYINYGYPQTHVAPATSLDFAEVHVGGGYGPVTVTYSDDSKDKLTYLDVSASFSLSDKVGMGLHYGSGTKSAYDTDYNVTLSAGDFTFGVSQWSKEKTYKPFVSYSKSFDM